MPELNLEDFATTMKALSEAKANLEQALAAASSVAKAAPQKPVNPRFLSV